MKKILTAILLSIMVLAPIQAQNTPWVLYNFGFNANPFIFDCYYMKHFGPPFNQTHYTQFQMWIWLGCPSTLNF